MLPVTGQQREPFVRGVSAEEGTTDVRGVSAEERSADVRGVSAEEGLTYTCDADEVDEDDPDGPCDVAEVNEDNPAHARKATGEV